MAQDQPQDSSSEESESDRQTADFLRLHSAHQPQIFAYILALLPNWDDAQEVLQETTVALWKSFGNFSPGSNFRAWACETAFHRVLSFRKRQKRHPHQLDDAFLEVVSAESNALADTLQGQLRALATCIEKLKPRDADLLRRCYLSGHNSRTVANELGRPPGTVYKTLTRIRRTLFACIERTLQAEGRQ